MITFSLKKKERQNMNKKSSGQKLSTQASKIMRSNNSSQIQKSLAASVLSQRNTGKITGKAMETKASMVMLSLIHISEPTRLTVRSRMPSAA